MSRLKPSITTDIFPMEPSSIVNRQRWLTNEPAEFVENGAALRALCHDAEPSTELERYKDTLEFSRDLDMFVPKDTAFKYVAYFHL
jgi:hypothetical protein